MNNRPKIRAAKYTVYVLIMLLLYVLQTTPRLFQIYDVKPNLVIPLAVAIAICEGEFIGGLFGALAGLLCDYGSMALFGFHGFIILVCCVAVGLLIIYMLRPTIVNFLLLLTGTLVFQGLVDYFLNFYMWDYARVELVLLRQILPGIGYTLVVSPPIYLGISRIYARFEVLLEE